ncbi:MAG: helix-turn-helix domain-containing protein [Pyrinomonadaceae bacterium]|nr:helix-turn-helix domain-containing protein [Pyrinomonadaceae bacterium]
MRSGKHFITHTKRSTTGSTKQHKRQEAPAISLFDRVAQAARATNNGERVTLTEAEFCRLVGISKTTAWARRKDGTLPHCRTGHRVLYLPEHVTQFLASSERNKQQEEA